MKLTQTQLSFFRDLDVSEAVKHGEGRVQFTFTHKGREVDVRPYSSGGGDIIVRLDTSREGRLLVDLDLSLFDIPETKNLSGPAMLKLLRDEVEEQPK